MKISILTLVLAATGCAVHKAAVVVAPPEMGQIEIVPVGFVAPLGTRTCVEGPNDPQGCVSYAEAGQPTVEKFACPTGSTLLRMVAPNRPVGSVGGSLQVLKIVTTEGTALCLVQAATATTYSPSALFPMPIPKVKSKSYFAAPQPMTATPVTANTP